MALIKFSTPPKLAGLFFCRVLLLLCGGCIHLHCTACVTLERITAPQHLQRIPDTTAAPGRWTDQRSRPIIIRYIRVQGRACYGYMLDGATHRRPCQRGGVSMLPTPGGLQSGTGSADRAGRSGTLHPAGQSSSRGARRAARNHWRLPPHLFSGFRPIANRGQQ